jgi:hypothetical protein
MLCLNKLFENCSQSAVSHQSVNQPACLPGPITQAMDQPSISTLWSPRRSKLHLGADIAHVSRAVVPTLKK